MTPYKHPFIDDMRYILASRINDSDSKYSENQTEQLLQMSLKELYRLAWSKNPTLHGDVELGRVFKNAMEDKRSREAWVEEGMSPLIFFAWKPAADCVSKPAWVGLSRSGYTLDRERLLGNLKPLELMAFLRDAVSLSGISYREVLEICTKVPELIKPDLFHRAQWDTNILGKAFWKGNKNTLYRQDRLSKWIPLLVVTLGGTDNEFFLARNLFRLHDSQDIKRLTTEALYNAELPGGHDGLMRYVELQFRNWENFTLDESIREAVAGSGILSVTNMQFWAEKAADTLMGLKDGVILAWPAAVYAAVYYHFCNEDADQTKDERQQAHRLMMEIHPRLSEIREYIEGNSAYSLQRALLGTYRELDLMSAEMISFLSPEARSAHAKSIAPQLASHIVTKIKTMAIGYDEPWKIVQQLKDADDQCSKAIVNHAQAQFSWSSLPPNLSDKAVENLLHLTLHELSCQCAAHDKTEAIAWCNGVRSRKWRPVVMRVLNLTPADVKLSSVQREAFLAEDLGL